MSGSVRCTYDHDDWVTWEGAMRELLAELTARDSPGVHLGMGATNARAERFYKKLGFHELARVRDALYLGKRLP